MRSVRWICNSLVAISSRGVLTFVGREEKRRRRGTGATCVRSGVDGRDDYLSVWDCGMTSVLCGLGPATLME